MSEPLLLSDGLDPWNRLRERMEAVRLGAACEGQLKRACAAPRDDCPHSVHQFCCARLLVAERIGLEEALHERLERAKEDAEDLCYPRRRRADLGIGVRDQPSLLHTPALTEVVAMESARLIVLTGQPGVGKSVAAAYWGWMRRALWWSAIRLCWFNVWEPTSWRLTQSKALVLDGLDRDWAGAPGVHQRNLKYVLNTRYDEQLPTLITTNTTEDEWYKMAGDRWRSARHADFAFILCGGDNLRVPALLSRLYQEQMSAPPAGRDDPF